MRKNAIRGKCCLTQAGVLSSLNSLRCLSSALNQGLATSTVLTRPKGPAFIARAFIKTGSDECNDSAANIDGRGSGGRRNFETGRDSYLGRVAIDSENDRAGSCYVAV